MKLLRLQFWSRIRSIMENWEEKCHPNHLSLIGTALHTFRTKCPKTSKWGILRNVCSHKLDDKYPEETTVIGFGWKRFLVIVCVFDSCNVWLDEPIRGFFGWPRINPLNFNLESSQEGKSWIIFQSIVALLRIFFIGSIAVVIFWLSWSFFRNIVHCVSSILTIFWLIWTSYYIS